jgi:hypothetical protein
MEQIMGLIWSHAGIRFRVIPADAHLLVFIGLRQGVNARPKCEAHIVVPFCWF